MLIASRALLGLAAATLAPSTLSLISNIFVDERERGLAIGVWIASFALGGAIGPVVGGLLLEQFWWGSVFLVAVPIMVLLLILGPLLLPEFRDPDSARIDFPSAVLSLMAILAMVYGIKQLVVGEGDAVALAALAGGVVVGALFVLRQLRLSDPMIDVKLLGRAQFFIPLAIYFLGLFLAFGMLLLLAHYLQLVLGQSPLEAGLWTLFSGAGFVAGSLLAPLVAGWLSAKLVMVGSLLLAASGFAVLGLGVQISQFPALLAGAALFSLGIGPVLALSTDLIVGAVPPERSGSAAAVAETASELGGAMGIAVAGSMALGSYRGSVAALLPAGLPNTVSDAMRDSLGSALVAASDLPAAMAGPSIAAVRTAFVGAFAQQAFMTAGVAILAVLLASRLRRT
jgi:DHA2 family multidrug resistance protein-like MFS transporter